MAGLSPMSPNVRNTDKMSKKCEDSESSMAAQNNSRLIVPQSSNHNRTQVKMNLGLINRTLSPAMAANRTGQNRISATG
jgi:hypothetical protein